MERELHPDFNLDDDSVRFIKITDAFTGESLDGIPVIQKPKIKWYEEDYAMVFLRAFGELSDDPEMKLNDWRVLAVMVSNVEMKNWCAIQQKDICERLRIHKSDMSKIIKKLVAKGLIEKDVKAGRIIVYRVNVDLFWRGTGFDYAQVRKQKNRKLGIVR